MCVLVRERCGEREIVREGGVNNSDAIRISNCMGLVSRLSCPYDAWWRGSLTQELTDLMEVGNFSGVDAHDAEQELSSEAEGQGGF